MENHLIIEAGGVSQPPTGNPKPDDIKSQDIVMPKQSPYSFISGKFNVSARYDSSAPPLPNHIKRLFT